jgi:hypothetical protein
MLFPLNCRRGIRRGAAPWDSVEGSRACGPTLANLWGRVPIRGIEGTAAALGCPTDCIQRLLKSLDGDEKLTICVLCFSTLRREPSNLRPAAGRVTQAERGGLGRRSAGSRPIVMYPHRCMPARLVVVRARRSSSPRGNPFSSTNRMQVDHITSDTSQGARSELAEPCLVVR